MARVSAGLLMYRRRSGRCEILLVHPGGPFFRNKDAGHWTIPKGEADEGESLLATARREFEEEIGVNPDGPFTPLNPVKQKGGKVVHAWAVEGECDPKAIRPNNFTIEWPPRSGKQASFPEIDRAEFFEIAAARMMINPAQSSFLDELEGLLGAS
ncbi:MAG: NUDIX domain-containing protein [Planctomycetaceae bacterium]|nr:NUDIX domain-containing protein [Planctomycetaceae bacterium]